MQNDTFQLPDQQSERPERSDIDQTEVDGRFNDMAGKERLAEQSRRPFSPEDLKAASAAILRNYEENKWLEHGNWDRDRLEEASKEIVSIRRQASADPESDITAKL